MRRLKFLLYFALFAFAGLCLVFVVSVFNLSGATLVET